MRYFDSFARISTAISDQWTFVALVLAMLGSVAGRSHAFGPAEDGTSNMTQATQSSHSPLIRTWTGPYGGVPAWHLVRPEEFVEAFKTAIEISQEEIGEIANQTEAPTFENTMLAMEKAGWPLERLGAIFGVHAGNLNVGPMPDIQRVVMPMLAEYEDSITQNEKLFGRIAAIYESNAMEDMTVAQRRLVEDRYKTFVRRGAKLSAEEKERLSKINKRLAGLFADFSQNVLDDEQNYVTWIDDENDLAGLPDSVIAAMASAAKERRGAAEPQGKWAVTNTRSSMDPFLTYADNRSLREKVWRTYYNRGDNGDSHDNNEIIAEILKLRAVRAKLLGYETHAHWRLEPQMAKTPEAAMDLMMKVWPKAVARVTEEVADMQEIADEEGAGITIEPWDYRYYAEKVRKAKYDLDFNEVKPYLQLEKLREAMMWAPANCTVCSSNRSRRARLSSRRARLGSHRRRRQACRAVVSRSVRPRRQTERCLDDRLSRAGEYGASRSRRSFRTTRTSSKVRKASRF